MLASARLEKKRIVKVITTTESLRFRGLSMILRKKKDFERDDVRKRSSMAAHSKGSLLDTTYELNVDTQPSNAKSAASEPRPIRKARSGELLGIFETSLDGFVRSVHSSTRQAQKSETPLREGE